MNFTRQELINMVYSLGQADRNILLAQRIYNQKYPDARMPQSAEFEKLRDRFEAAFVLSLAVSFSPVHSYNNFSDTVLIRPKRSPRQHHHHTHEFWYDPYYQHDISLPDAGKMLSPRENQMLIRHETKNRSAVDCCPSVLEMVEPEGGKNQDDQYVELYRDGENRQRFYELSCHKDMVGKPCRFMDRKLHNQSRCIQKYSYTYALVKDPGRHHHQRPNYFPAFPSTDGATFTLDYIRVRSGCSCVVMPNIKKKRDKKIKKKDKYDLDDNDQ